MPLARNLLPNVLVELAEAKGKLKALREEIVEIVGISDAEIKELQCQLAEAQAKEIP